MTLTTTENTLYVLILVMWTLHILTGIYKQIYPETIYYYEPREYIPEAKVLEIPVADVSIHPLAHVIVIDNNDIC